MGVRGENEDSRRQGLDPSPALPSLIDSSVTALPNYLRQLGLTFPAPLVLLLLPHENCTLIAETLVHVKVSYSMNTQRQLYVFMAPLRVSRLRVSADPQVLDELIVVQRGRCHIHLYACIVIGCYYITYMFS